MRIAVFVLSLLFSLAACAEGDAQNTYEAGKHYHEINPAVRTITGDKIEVAEVFWYGCGHCYKFEQLVKPWEKTLAADVELVKNPAIWRDVMALHSRIYFAAKALGVDEVVSDKAFAALNGTPRQSLADEESIAKLFKEVGVAEEDFKKAFNSFGVKAQVQQADARARSFGISGTPELVIAGKYRISGRLLNSQEDMLKVANFLIEKERAAKKAGK